MNFVFNIVRDSYTQAGYQGRSVSNSNNMEDIINIIVIIFQVCLGIAVPVGLIAIFLKLQERREEERRKEEFHLLNKTLNTIKNGNKLEKVDALIKVSKTLEDCDSYYKDEFEDKIDSTTKNLDLESANLSNSRFAGIYFSDSNLRDANLENSKFIKTSFLWVDLERANLKNSALTFSKFVNANLEGAYLYGVKFDNANLLGANLKGANLQRTDISKSLIKLSDVNPKDSLISIYDVEMKREKLTPPNFKDAIYDCTTKFPKDFNPENEGMIEVDSIPPKTSK